MAEQDSSADRLGGWKAIAAYLDRSVRTVQRWEVESGLPVRRVHLTGSVMAYRHEIDLWRESDRGREALAEVNAAARVAKALASPRPGRFLGVPPPPPPRPGDDEGVSHVSDVSPAGGPAMPRPRRRPYGAGILVLVLALVSAAFSWRWVRTADLSLVCPGDCTVRQGQTLVLRADGAGQADTFVRWIQSSSGRVESFKPSLAPDAAGTITWGFTTDCTSAPGQYALRLVHETTTLPTNTVQVRIVPTAACATPVADLVAEGVAVEPVLGHPAQLVTCRFRLRNQGAVAAPASIARLRLGKSPDRTAVTDRMLADVAVPAIAVGETVDLETSFHLPHGASSGVPYYVWVVADNGSAVLERVSINNFARSSAITFAGPAAR